MRPFRAAITFAGIVSIRPPALSRLFVQNVPSRFPVQSMVCLPVLTAQIEHWDLMRPCPLIAAGVVRFIVLQFKYNRQLQLRHPIAEWLEEAMNDPRLRPRHFDLVVPVPLHPARLRERGFNQAELLAKILAQKINIPLGCALERIRYTTTQTAFDRVERMENLRGAFRLRKKIGVRGLHVLLVDDILTTGSTLSECARVLREAGARSVYAVTAARA